MSEEEGADADADSGPQEEDGQQCKKLQRKLLADLEDVLAHVRSGGGGSQVERLLESVRERVVDLPRFQPGGWEAR